MADKRISDLGTLSSLQDDDLLIVTDVSTSETKKVTYATVKNGIAAGSGSLTDIVQEKYGEYSSTAKNLVKEYKDISKKLFGEKLKGKELLKLYKKRGT